MQIFSKTLSQTDISKRCVVPMKYFTMKRFPKPKEGSHIVEFLVTDESCHRRTLWCCTRNVGEDPDHPKHPKPVLTKGWIQFVKSWGLRVGDTVIINEKQDQTGSMYLTIKAEKRASPPEAHQLPVENQNLDGKNGSIRYNSNNEAPAISQHLSFGVANHDLGGNTAVKTSSIDKEQIPSHPATSQHIASHKTELSLELTLKPTMTGGATSSSIDNEQKPTFHSNSQDIAINNTETPCLSLSLGLTLKPTTTGEKQDADMQETELKTIDFLRSFNRA